jgi:DNA polymerase IV
LRCKDLIFVRPRFEVYREVSEQIRAIFRGYTDLVEPVSLDEAYLDVSTNKLNIPSAMEIARQIKQRIQAQTQLTASAGVSINKFLAKMASDLDKPDGLSLIPPDRAQAFVSDLPIAKFHGIGKVTAGKMHDLGIQSGEDLLQWSEADLVTQFGKVGHYYYRIARAEDDRAVNPNRIRQSIGAERSFLANLTELEQMMEELAAIATLLHQRLAENQHSATTLTLKIKYANYQQITRSRTLSESLAGVDIINQLAQELLLTHLNPEQEVRLLGLTVSNLRPPGSGPKQLSLPFEQKR